MTWNNIFCLIINAEFRILVPTFSHEPLTKRNNMALKEKIEGDIAILTLKGDLIGDPETTELKDKVGSLLADEISKIVFDLGKVKYINSTGLGSLISALGKVRDAGGKLLLARVGDNVLNLFVITQLVKVFDTYETVDRALAVFKTKKK